MLGLFDSGVGGLTVLRAVHQRLPKHDLLFFADQAHVPYGDRSPDELRHLLEINIAWLEEAGARAVVMACNTSCAMASARGWPTSAIPVLDLIETAAIVVERTAHRRIAVIATAATARSGAYRRAIAERCDARVTEIAAPALVPLVESGESGPRSLAAVAAVCADLPRDIDAIVYGCTHYPLLDAQFAAVLGESVERIDPAIGQAERAAELTVSRAIPAGNGRIRCISNGDAERFAQSLRCLAGGLPGLEIPKIQRRSAV